MLDTIDRSSSSSCVGLVVLVVVSFLCRCWLNAFVILSPSCCMVWICGVGVVCEYP